MKPHCDGGAYVGGEFVSIEDCADKFLCKDKQTSGCKPGIGFASTKRCAGCVRSRSRNTSAKPDGSYDVVIIGAGGIGCAIARELSKTNAHVLLLEAADDVTQGATKGNSGIVHAGFDDKPGSVRSKFCPTGCRMFPQLDEELHFGFQKNGSLVLARNDEDRHTLQRLLEQGKTNGVKKLRIMEQDELRKREPHLHPDITCALFAEDAGTIIPYEYCVALAENAVDNGVELRIRRQVTGIEQLPNSGGFMVTAQHWEPDCYTKGQKGSSGNMVKIFSYVALSVGVLIAASVLMGRITQKPIPLLHFAPAIAVLIPAISFISSRFGGDKQGGAEATGPKVDFEPSLGTKFGAKNSETEVIKASFVVNAAGCKSDLVAAMVGDTSFKVNERYGDYVLLHKKEGKLASSTLFPCPGPKGKGVLVQATAWGNLILGPTARDKYVTDPKTGELVLNPTTQNDTPESVMKAIFPKCRELVPKINAREVIHTFTGARAKTTRGDWIIEPCPTAKRMIHAAGIDSPGLASSPAIALEVVRLLKAAGATVLDEPNPTFNPIRAPLVIPKRGMKDAFGTMVKMGPEGKWTNPDENIVCKCEKVTEAEIVQACRRSLPIDSTQAIRRRTRAGMGHCQAAPDNYCCEERVVNIIARETGLKPSQVERRPWPASSFMPHRFFTDADRDWVNKVSQEE